MPLNRELAIHAPTNFDQLCDAYNLVYQEYRAAGLISSNQSKLRISIYQLLSSFSHTYVVTNDEILIGTGSVVLNSPAGLPCSDNFQDVVDALALQERCVVEGTLLGCRPHGSFKGSDISRELICYGLSWSIAAGADDFIVVANPRHLKFWQDTLGFECLSDSRSCSHVEDAPGHFLRLDLKGILEGSVTATPTLKELAFDRLIPASELNCWYELTDDHVCELLCAEPEILRNINSVQYAILSDLYPDGLVEAEQTLLSPLFNPAAMPNEAIAFRVTDA